MDLQINGRNVSISDNIQNVFDLLKYYELDQAYVIVELNEQIIQKEAFEKKQINNGDRVEIVHFVGGG